MPTDLFTCQHCGSRRGLNLVAVTQLIQDGALIQNAYIQDGALIPNAYIEKRRCVACEKSSMFHFREYPCSI